MDIRFNEQATKEVKRLAAIHRTNYLNIIADALATYDMLTEHLRKHQDQNGQIALVTGSGELSKRKVDKLFHIPNFTLPTIP